MSDTEKTSKEIAISVFRELATTSHNDPDIRLRAAQSLMDYAVYGINGEDSTEAPEVTVD